MRIVRTLVHLTAVVALLAGGALPAHAQTLTTVRVGMLRSTTDAPLWLADKLGYFRDEGISVQFLTFTSGEAMTVPLSMGQLDVGAGSPSASLYNAVARGMELRLVADLGSDPPGYGFEQMLVRSELVRSGRYKTPADFKGLTVATNARGSISQPQLAKFLAHVGLHESDVKHVFLPYPEQGVALKNGSIDAASTIEPFATDAIKNGYAVKVMGNDVFDPNQQISTLMYGGTFTKQHRDLALKFMRAYLRGVRYYNDALAGGRIAGANADTVIKILAQESKMEPAILRSIVPTGANPDGRLNVQSLRDDLAYFRQQGLIEGSVSADGIVDGSFVAAAVRDLGPYKRAKR
jgi:NitT/TauT family transport system substrate-binding protein